MFNLKLTNYFFKTTLKIERNLESQTVFFRDFYVRKIIDLKLDQSRFLKEWFWFRMASWKDEIVSSIFEIRRMSSLAASLSSAWGSRIFWKWNVMKQILHKILCKTLSMLILFEWIQRGKTINDNSVMMILSHKMLSREFTILNC